MITQMFMQFGAVPALLITLLILIVMGLSVILRRDLKKPKQQHQATILQPSPAKKEE